LSDFPLYVIYFMKLDWVCVTIIYLRFYYGPPVWLWKSPPFLSDQGATVSTSPNSSHLLGSAVPSASSFFSVFFTFFFIFWVFLFLLSVFLFFCFLVLVSALAVGAHVSGSRVCGPAAHH